MAVITAQIVIDKAEIILQDTTNVRWASTELLGWLNDGQRAVVALKPDAYPQNENMILIEGTKQSIPATGVHLIDVVRNMGTDGSTPGRATMFIDRRILDAQNPDWHADVAAAEVKHWMFDKRDPKTFYVYPPQPAASFGYVEFVYSAAPADILIAAVLSIDDIYANSLLEYILYRAYSKDADYAANGKRASDAMVAFATSLGLREASEDKMEPQMNASRQIHPKGGTGA